jgi:hypothetical protein
MLFKNLILVSMFLLGCDPGQKEIKRTKSKKSKSSESVATSQPSSPISASLTSPAVLSIKNCDQILRAMEKLTGVSRLSPEVNAAFLKVEGSCPQDSKPDSFDAAQMVAVNTLALEFCGVYTEQAATNGSIKDLDLNKIPELAFTEPALASLYQTFYSQIWMGPRQGIPPFEDMKKELDVLVNELRKTNKKTPQATKAIAQGLCAAVLGAAPVIVQ